MTRSQSTPASSQIIWLERRVAELEKQRDELQKDADRYRWLKANIREGYEFGSGYYLSDESDGWDKTIDKAMQGEGK